MIVEGSDVEFLDQGWYMYLLYMLCFFAVHKLLLCYQEAHSPATPVSLIISFF